MTTTVSASAASAAWDPSQYMQVSTAAPPAATGITGIFILYLLLAKAVASSVRATAKAAPMYSRNVALTVSRVRITRPPRAAPTPIATGRLRPVRDTRLRGSGAGAASGGSEASGGAAATGAEGPAGSAGSGPAGSMAT